MLAGLAVLLADRAASATWQDLRATGGASSLWVLYETYTPQGRQTRVWMRQLDRRFRRPRQGREQPVGVRAAAALGNKLHIFLANGAHYRMGPQRISPQRILPGRAVALYLAGDSAQDALYAVAKGAPSSSDQPTMAATQRAAPPPSTTTATVPAPEWALYRFVRGQWTRAADMPTGFDQDDEHWLCADEGRVHLFGLGRGPDAPVWYCGWDDERWTSPEIVPVGPQANPVAAMVVNTYLVLVSQAPTGEGGSKVVVHRRRPTEKWQTSELRTSNNEPIDISPDQLAVSALNDRIAVIGQFPGAERPSAGFWSLEGGPPDGAIKPLPKWPEPADEPMVPMLPEIAILAVLGAVMALTLWRRPDTVMREIPLPDQAALASIWRRLGAFALDVAPAIAVTAIYWLPIWAQVQQDMAIEDLSQAEQAEHYAVLLWPWLIIRVIYAVYCGLTEYRWGASPGKRLMRCWVLSVDLTRPRPKQIAIRNAVKILELQPEILPLLVFIAFTRNRQRLGDLLAGTIVVEPGIAPGEPGE